MLRYMEIMDEEEGKEWCAIHGFRFLEAEYNEFGSLVMAFEDMYDGIPVKKKSTQTKKPSSYVIASYLTDGSPMYRAKDKMKNRYTFDVNSAQLFSKEQAETVARLMTVSSIKSGRCRNWYIVKYC